MSFLYSASTTLKTARRALLGLLSLGAAPALAQTIYTPVALTASSFTADVVADGAATAIASTTAGFDTGGTDIAYCMVAPNFVSPTSGAPTQSLPANRVLTSPQAATPGLTFQLQPYSGLNSQRIAGTGTGTMTLVTPRAANSIWLAAATGNGSGLNPVTATVVFTDNTTQVFTVNVPDWFGGANYVANNLGRVGRPNDRYYNSTGEPRIYQFELALLPANYGKLVSAVQFAKTQPTGVTTATVFNGFALTLAAPCTLPASIAAQATPATICPGQSATLAATLTGTGAGYSGQWQSSPDGVTWTDIAGATGPTYTVTPAATTRYRYRTICSAALTLASTAVTVTIAPNTATLAYPNASYCRTGTTGAPTVTPATGTFTASPAGLSLNATTGDINLAASQGGTYVVSYTSTGLCPATATFSLTVVAPNVVLAYATTSFCRVGTSGPPAYGPAGGTFSSTAGLALNPATGQIDLPASSPGTYVVSYTSTGQCPTTVSTTVEVKSDALPTFPNVLVASGDARNRALKLEFKSPLADVNNYHLSVFSRWGRKMYEGSNPAEGWVPDNASAGTYYYTVDYTDCAGRPQHYKGWVDVIK